MVMSGRAQVRFTGLENFVDVECLLGSLFMKPAASPCIPCCLAVLCMLSWTAQRACAAPSALLTPPPSVLRTSLPGLPEWARCVVFDEADLLLSGAYGAQMRIIWDALRAGDRLHAARRVCAEVRGGRGLCDPFVCL